ncbi:MAG: U32 family peptidase [Deltaproteobacteria bacterium]|nr:U32 family peptidase [Deltaproteobacteria bacterium]
MPPKNTKIELLAPVGNFEKLEIAVHYGADAVYLADKKFSLRNFSDNFSFEEMKKATEFASENNVKVYVACNIYTRNFEQKDLEAYLADIGKINPDALIVADPGVFWSARRLIPAIPLHLSTQANTTNYRTVQFWEELGVKRVNMARELSLEEINEISRQTSAEIEAFVHGAMCISYSGRCLLSSFLTKRDSNRGMCSHPCRWSYSVVEELRPGEYMPIEEDSRGTYIFNSRDLCMIEHIPEMIHAGITSLKIEGRMKSINYLASTIKVYREAIDAFYADPDNFRVKKEWINQITSINHRDYCTGFYFNDPDQVAPNYINSKPLEGHKFIGKVLEDKGQNLSLIQVRNKIFTDDRIEILAKNGPVRHDTIFEIINSNQHRMDFAQPGEVVSIRLNQPCQHNDLIRRTGEKP